MQQTESKSAPVLFLIDTLVVGGSEKKTVAVSSELARRGHPVHIAYLNPPAPLAEWVDSRVPLVCLGRKLSFAAIGRLAEYVRVHGLVAQGVHAQCLIAGDGPERNALRGMVADLGVGERVVFAGISRMCGRPCSRWTSSC